MTISDKFQQEMTKPFQSGFSGKVLDHFSQVSTGYEMIISVRYPQEMTLSFQPGFNRQQEMT